MAGKEKKHIPNSVIARLDWAEKTLHAILYGDKPAIDPKNPEQSWLLKQMSRMYRAGFLCEEPGSYVLLAGEKPDDVLRYKGVTLREPLPKFLTTETKNLKAMTNKRDIKNYKVLGTDNAYRYGKDVLDQAQDADAFVLTPGGTMELYQWILFLRAQYEETIDLSNKHFIVQNYGAFWEPTLKAFQNLYNNSGNNIVTDTLHGTVEALEDVLPESVRAHEPSAGDPNGLLTPGSTILVATGNRKKYNETKLSAYRRGTNVDFQWWHQQFDKPEGAEEFSYSYVGNLVEKIEKFYEHIRDFYGPEGFREAMRDKGYDIAKSVLWFDDSGLDGKENFFDGPEFSNCSYRTNPYKKHGPGPELKNVINAMQGTPFKGHRGIRSMAKRVEAAAERKYQERVDAGAKKPDISLDFFDRSVVAIVPLKEFTDAIELGMSFADVMDKAPMHFFQACTEQELLFDPRPDVPAADSKNFLVPKMDPDGLSQAEISNYPYLHGIAAQVMKTVVRTFGLEKYETTARGLTAQFNGRVGESWKLGTQQSIHKGVNTHGLDLSATRAMKGMYKMMGGNSGHYDLSLPRDHLLILPDDTEGAMFNALNNFDDFTRRADGFVMTPGNPRLNDENHFWHHAFFLFSLIVGKQINDKSVSGKPLVVMESEISRPLLDLVDHYYGTGLIGDRPEYLIDKVLKPGEDLVQTLHELYARYRPDEVQNYAFSETGQKCPEELFDVTIYCSASSTDGHLKDWARDFSFDCASLGFAIKNGGGTGPDGLMLETSLGAHMVRGPFDQYLKSEGLCGAPETHVTSIQCVATEQDEGLPKFNDYCAVYETIYQRMHELQNVCAEVILPGGAGTIQEIAASILMRSAGIYPVENRPLIIVNHEGIYDPFIKLIPKADFEKYNIRVVDTKDEALELLVESRRAKGMEPLLPYSREELAAHKEAFMKTMNRPKLEAALKSFTL
ncbi:MAG: LOG family protein [Rhodospirillales bacterium]|nr:LOG family protein [Rhodospirillales bacterium]MCB9995069.1 LOG family protein [Rhodospirillales bacterium]